MNPDYKRFLEENPDRVKGNPEDGALFSGVLRRLRSLPEPEARGGFAERVLERVRREEAARAAAEAAARRTRPLRWVAGIAAALALAWAGMAGVGAWKASEGGAAGQALARAEACEVIVSEQGADGAWRAAGEAGGNSFWAGRDGALSAIALVALMRSEADPLQGPHAGAVWGGMEHLIALQSAPRGLGDGATRAGMSSRYLVAMALRAGASLPGAPAEWRAAAGRAAGDMPPPAEAARLNRQLAHAASMPEPWKRAGGPVLAAALELLEPRAM